ASKLRGRHHAGRTARNGHRPDLNPGRSAMYRMRLLTGFVAAAMSLGLTSGAFAQVEIKFGHVGEPGSLFAQSAEEFAKRPTRGWARRARSLCSARASSEATRS